jgi:hypothetical protein
MATLQIAGHELLQTLHAKVFANTDCCLYRLITVASGNAGHKTNKTNHFYTQYL